MGIPRDAGEEITVNKETALMRRIMIALSDRGCFVLRTNAGTYYDSRGNRVTIGFPGLSDLIGCTADGKFFAIEVKLPGQKPRQNQLDFLAAMRERGALAGWCGSVEEALKIINQN